MLLMLQYGYNRLPVLLAEQLPRLNQALVVIVSLALCVLPFVALAFTGIGYAAWPLALAVPALLWSVWAMPQQRRRDEKLWAAQLAFIDYLRDNFSR